MRRSRNDRFQISDFKFQTIINYQLSIVNYQLSIVKRKITKNKPILWRKL